MSEQKKSRYLQYLPAVFQEDPFLGGFLAPFEEVLDDFGDKLSGIDRHFAPALTDSDFLPWLAGWLALALDDDWDEGKKRRLIAEAVELYRRRGTVKGLKRYLEIYAGLVPEIRECRRPGGMQIGVTSRIGGTVPEDAPLSTIQSAARVQPLTRDDYYVVDITASGRHQQIYYSTTLVKKVATGYEEDTRQPYVDIYLHSHDEPEHYVNAGISRRDGLADNHYSLTTGTDTDTTEVEYIGDTFLVDEEELPYCFIVDARVSFDRMEDVKLDKVRAIVNLEKPAHTMYYLKLTPVVSEYVLHPMQIGIRPRCTIGLNTIIG